MFFYIRRIEKTMSGKKHTSLTLPPSGALGNVKLASVLRHMHIIITQHALIYCLNYLGKKIY